MHPAVAKIRSVWVPICAPAGEGEHLHPGMEFTGRGGKLEGNMRPLYCARAVLPRHAHRGHGRIINISGGTVFAAMPMLSANVVSKSALYKRSENLA
jgi:hypothetical protein